jgi:hypothetical protein
MADEELLTFQRFMLAFDTPAYMRRARQVEAEWTHLVAFCERERERLLELPRLRLAQLIVATGAEASPERLPVTAEDRRQLLDLQARWQTELRSTAPTARTPAAAAHLVRELILAFELFNARWDAFITQRDLAPVNKQRDGYNRYYVLEKECAVRSSKTARDGFEPLSPATLDDLRQLFPPLPVPLGVDA